MGRSRADETIRIWANEGSMRTVLLTVKTADPGRFFTSGFLIDLFAAVKNQQVREVRSIAMGDPYCEREIV